MRRKAPEGSYLYSGSCFWHCYCCCAHWTSSWQAAHAYIYSHRARMGRWTITWYDFTFSALLYLIQLPFIWIFVGHPLRFWRAMGMQHHVFRKLVRDLQTRTWLAPTRWVSAEEQLAIFLYIARTGQANVKCRSTFNGVGILFPSESTVHFWWWYQPVLT